MKTCLSEPQLVEIRAEARERISRFVDPAAIFQCSRVLDRRGEEWAASVLGRDISRRSLAVANRPYLRDGEEYALTAADWEETTNALAELA